MRRLLATASAAALVGGAAAPAVGAGPLWTGRYVVRPGDSLTAVAAEHRVSLARLAAANGLDPSRPLVIGAVLKVPAAAAARPVWGGRYTVRLGDSLSAIALRFGTSLGALVQANGLDVRRPLPIGAVLKVPAAAAARPVWAGRYTVRPGDSLSAIALRFGTSLRALVRANGLDPSRPLLVGTRLRVPRRAAAAPRFRVVYVVRPGDSLSAIALRFGTSLGALSQANALDPRNPLPIGRRLRVPAPAPPSHGEVAALIDTWAARYRVDPRLARAVAWMESGYQNAVVSSTGAVGVMQVQPDTWAFVETVLVGHPLPHTVAGNVRAGVAYLHHLLGEFDGDARLALAAYYQGERAVRQRGLLEETKAYVADVLALRERV